MAGAVLAAARAQNADRGGSRWGPVGVVVGATVGDVRAVAGDLAVGGPILAPGLGAQGASRVTSPGCSARRSPTSWRRTSREVLGAGAGLAGRARTAALRAAAARTLRAVTTAVGSEAT